MQVQKITKIKANKENIIPDIAKKIRIMKKKWIKWPMNKKERLINQNFISKS